MSSLHVFRADTPTEETTTRLTLTTFLTLDGILQAPGAPTEDPSDGFEYGGWLVPIADADMGEAMARWFAEADALPDRAQAVDLRGELAARDGSRRPDRLAAERPAE